MSIENLSPHFTYREGIYSATAQSRKIDNSPNEVQLTAMKYTASKMEEVRAILEGRPIYVTSWFRSYALNKAIGGAQKSQHSNGEAVDFKCPGFGTPRAICEALIANKKTLQYDQLILEPGWVHISFVADRQPRLNELTFLGTGAYANNIIS